MGEISKPEEELIQAMSDNEYAVGGLYQLYAEKFPKFKDFWLHLVEDEKNHGIWLKQLLENVQSGEVVINKDRFNAKAIKSFTEHVTRLKKMAQSEDVTLTNALSNAKDIEGGLIELDFFEVYESDSPKLKLIFNDLRRVTKIHDDMVTEAWNKESGLLN